MRYIPSSNQLHQKSYESFDGAQLISSGKFSKKNFPVAYLIRTGEGGGRPGVSTHEANFSASGFFKGLY
jgi:hypothetical protein